MGSAVHLQMTCKASLKSCCVVCLMFRVVQPAVTKDHKVLGNNMPREVCDMTEHKYTALCLVANHHKFGIINFGPSRCKVCLHYACVPPLGKTLLDNYCDDVQCESD